MVDDISKQVVAIENPGSQIVMYDLVLVFDDNSRYWCQKADRFQLSHKNRGATAQQSQPEVNYLPTNFLLNFDLPKEKEVHSSS